MLIGLIGCNKSKMTAPDSVRQLYRFSDLFTGALRYLGGRVDVIYALSPTHGLLTLDAVVPPERRTLRNGTSTWRLAWARQVVAALREHHGPSLAGITVELHATPSFRQPLKALLQKAGAVCTCPIEATSVAGRLAFYATVNRLAVAEPAADLSAPVFAARVDPVPEIVPAPKPFIESFSLFLRGLQGQSLRTWNGSTFRVAEVEADSLTVVPDSTGWPRMIGMAEVVRAYKLLHRNGSLTAQGARGRGSPAYPAYVLAILAALPGVSPSPSRGDRIEWQP